VHGFKGVIWGGYQGDIPKWATPLKRTGHYDEYRVTEHCVIRFIPVFTTIHLARHKPVFIKSILESDKSIDAIAYFDPDIVVCWNWSYYEEWMKCGVAVCEDLASPYSANHPLRAAWRKLCETHGIKCHDTSMTEYANSGFVGVTRENAEILDDWQKVLGLVQIHHPQALNSFPYKDRSHPFFRTDQDALNAAAMFSRCPLSLLNKTAMCFTPGFPMMAHAAGTCKPWKKPLIAAALNGVPPSRADKEFVLHSGGPIRAFSALKLMSMRAQVTLAAMLGRFIRRAS